MLHQIKAQQFYTDLGLLSTVLSPTENKTIQGLFKAFELFSSTFQGRFNFQRLFNSITFQACANPVKGKPRMHANKIISDQTAPLIYDFLLVVKLTHLSRL